MLIGWVKSHTILLTLTPSLDSINSSPTEKEKKKQMDLIEQYTRLGWAVEEQEVPVYDPNLDVFTNRPYATLLKTGTVVYFKGRKHFFCAEFGLPLLEGSWVDEEGSCRATAEFLFYVLNEDEAITIVNI